MAIKDYLKDKEEKHSHEMPRYSYLNIFHPEACKKATQRDAKHYYDRICEKIADEIEKGKKKIKGCISIDEHIELDIPDEGTISERLYDFKYKECFWFSSYKCWLNYKNPYLMDMLFDEIEKLCDQDDIELEPFCIKVHSKYFPWDDQYSLNETFRVARRAERGGGYPMYSARLVLCYSYINN